MRSRTWVMVIVVCGAAIGSGCGSSGAASVASSQPSGSATTPTTTTTQSTSGGVSSQPTPLSDAAVITAVHAKLSRLGIKVRAAVGLITVQQHQILVVTTTLKGPKSAQQAYVSRYLCQPFTRMLPIGQVNAAVFGSPSAGTLSGINTTNVPPC